MTFAPGSTDAAPAPTEISEHLVFRTGGQVCALPVTTVEETLRPLPISEVAGELPFLLGVAVLRGKATPVVDLARLLIGRDEERPARWISIRSGDRRLAIAVDSVIGVRSFEEAEIGALPNLLRGQVGDRVEAMALRDGDLLFVLRAGHILPEESWPKRLDDDPGAA